MTAADPQALEQALRGVDQRVEPVPWSEYANALSEAFARWLRDRIDRLDLPIPPGTGTVIAWTIVALLAASLAILIGRAVLAWVRRARAREAGGPAAIAEPPTPPARPTADWAAEAQARLARGDLRGALEAAWWWLATGLRATVDPSSTTRELVLGAGRRDLVTLARRLDGLTYGAAAPSRADVQDLLRRVSGAVS
jgi:hypothetical protein